MAKVKRKQHKRKPTLKQRLFAQEYLKTGNGVQSALKVYGNNNYNSANGLAIHNLNAQPVIDLIEEKFKRSDINVDYVLKGQKKLAEGHDVENAVKAKVLKDIGEFLYMYKDKGTGNTINNIYGEDLSDAEQTRKIEDIERRQRERRSFLAGEGNSGVQPTERPASSKDL